MDGFTLYTVTSAGVTSVLEVALTELPLLQSLTRNGEKVSVRFDELLPPYTERLNGPNAGKTPRLQSAFSSAITMTGLMC